MSPDPVPFADPREFVPELLAACPELAGDWVDSDVRDPEQPYHGLFLAFAFAVLPTLSRLLDPTDPTGTVPPGVTGAAPKDLLARMYAVIERAAVSPDGGLRGAVCTELGSGYGRLTRADLLTYAGPRTRQLITAADP